MICTYSQTFRKKQQYDFRRCVKVQWSIGDLHDQPKPNRIYSDCKGPSRLVLKEFGQYVRWIQQRWRILGEPCKSILKNAICSGFADGYVTWWLQHSTWRGWDLNFTYHNTNTADYFVTGNEIFNSWSHAHHLAWNIRACEQIQYEDSWKFCIWVLGCISRKFWHRLNWQNFCTGSLTL